jgi:hypothetical protein
MMSSTHTLPSNDIYLKQVAKRVHNDDLVRVCTSSPERSFLSVVSIVPILLGHKCTGNSVAVCRRVYVVEWLILSLLLKYKKLL